jgi:hypothetical protein
MIYETIIYIFLFISLIIYNVCTTYMHIYTIFICVYSYIYMKCSSGDVEVRYLKISTRFPIYEKLHFHFFFILIIYYFYMYTWLYIYLYIHKSTYFIGLYSLRSEYKIKTAGRISSIRSFLCIRRIK